MKNLIKKILFFLVSAFIFVGLTAFVKAQTITLNNSELVKLQQLVQSDSSASKQFSSFQKLADESLKDSPNPIETVTTEGRLKGDPKKTATAESLLDIRKIYALSIVCRVKNDENYFKKAVEFLNAWATVNHPTGDPIDETNFDGVFESYDLLRDKFAPQDKSQIEQWFRAIAKAEINFPKMAKGKITAMNNWNSHRLKIVGEIAWTLNDAELKKYVLENLKTQLSANLNADGTSFDFLERDALHYHCYDLQPLTKLAIIIKRNGGTDFYNYQTDKQASIAKSVDFLVPFISGEKTHEEFVNTKVEFDKARAKNNEKGYVSGTLFNPSEGLDALTLAAWFTPKLLDTVRKAKNDEQKFPNWQAVLNQVMN